MLEWNIFQESEEIIPSAEKTTIPHMKAKLFFCYFIEKPKYQEQKIVIFQLHQYPVYYLGTIFEI